MSVSPRGGTEVKVCQQTHDSTVGRVPSRTDDGDWGNIGMIVSKVTIF